MGWCWYQVKEVGRPRLSRMSPVPHYKGGTRWYIGVGNVIGENYGRLIIEDRK